MFLALVVWFVMAFIPAVKILTIFGTLFWLLIIFITGLTWGMHSTYESKELGIERKERFNSVAWHVRWIAPIIVFAAILPNRETSWWMISAYAGQTLAQSDVAKEIGVETKDALKELIARAKRELASDVVVPNANTTQK